MCFVSVHHCHQSNKSSIIFDGFSTLKITVMEKPCPWAAPIRGRMMEAERAIQKTLSWINCLGQVVTREHKTLVNEIQPMLLLLSVCSVYGIKREICCVMKNLCFVLWQIITVFLVINALIHLLVHTLIYVSCQSLESDTNLEWCVWRICVI